MGISTSSISKEASLPPGFSVRWFVPPNSYFYTTLGLQSRRRTRGIFVTDDAHVLAVERG